jgi:DNA sulfur modification protein DndB
MKFEFPAVQGLQGGRQYFATCIPFRALSRMLAIDTGNTLDRSQRDVDEKRAKALAEYIKDNPQGFVIPSLTGVINADELKFTEHKEGTFAGTISVPMDAEIKLFDGQHRAVGILLAIKECAGLGANSVPVQLFTDMSLAARQQAFSDINSNAKAVSTSLNQTYNKRDEATQALADIAADGPLASYIEYEKNSVAGKSEKFFALKNVVDANRILLRLGKKVAPQADQVEFAKRWWKKIARVVKWENTLIFDGFTAERGREEFITYHAVGLMALARLWNIISDHGYFTDDHITEIERRMWNINFTRSNPCWRGLCVSDDGKMISGLKAQEATAQEIYRQLNLPEAAVYLEQPQTATLEASIPSEVAIPSEAVEFAVLIENGHHQTATILALMFGMKDFFTIHEFDQAEQYLAATEDDEEVISVGHSEWYSPFRAAVAELVAFQIESDIIKTCITQAIAKLETQGRISYLEIKAITKLHMGGEGNKTKLDPVAFKEKFSAKGGAA